MNTVCHRQCQKPFYTVQNMLAHIETLHDAAHKVAPILHLLYYVSCCSGYQLVRHHARFNEATHRKLDELATSSLWDPFYSVLIREALDLRSYLTDPAVVGCTRARYQRQLSSIRRHLKKELTLAM